MKALCIHTILSVVKIMILIISHALCQCRDDCKVRNQQVSGTEIIKPDRFLIFCHKHKKKTRQQMGQNYQPSLTPRRKNTKT